MEHGWHPLNPFNLTISFVSSLKNADLSNVIGIGIPFMDNFCTFAPINYNNFI
jgi:hypothetical protein